ncbi:DUF4156 domain-containing protein [Aliivibrio kagoshimensis]|uniref:DUF4156 domain-containing protein n=1 Tax=Aliivibrio kagoshimensis TaxID=2910230 RepID=UPI003D112DA5
MFKKYFVLLTVSLLLVGCSTFEASNLAPPVDGSNSVQIHFDRNGIINRCEWVKELIGSEGHWYTYLFISNNQLVQSSITQLKNQAYEAGADTVVIFEPFYFSTSVTLLGNAYACNNR